MVTRSEALYLKVVTEKQSTSLRLFDHRVRLITASIVYEVPQTNQNQPSSYLLEQLCSSGHKKINTAPIEWGGGGGGGGGNEDTAHSDYSRQQKEAHT